MSIQTPPPTSYSPAQKTVSFGSSLAVTNAILTSTATQTGASVVTVFNGAQAGGPFVGTSAASNTARAARTVTVTTASHAGSYVTGAGNAITVKGTDLSGNVITDTLALTAANGGETVVSVKGFASVTEIDIPGQNDALGSFTFGVQDVLMGFRAVRANVAGNIKYACALDGTIDTPPINAGETMTIAGRKLFGDSVTTATGITLYL